MIDVNDIENRIAVLYRVTDPFVKMESVRAIHVEQKQDESDPTGKTFRVEFGGGPTSPSDELDIQATLNNIIHHLANLKDNLKNQLRSSRLQPSEVENQINSDRNLQLVADLCNQEKHGYPLSRTRRSRLDPLIANIRHELAVPLTIGFSNVFGDSTVVVDADINDGAGNFVVSFREMIDGAIQTWEDFCLTHIPARSKEIADRREVERKQEEWANAINARLETVNAIVENESNWHQCPINELARGMMVSVYKESGGKRLWRGFITALREHEKTYARVHDPMMTMDSDYDIAEHEFMNLAPGNPNDFQFVSDHYLDVAEFRKTKLGR